MKDFEEKLGRKFSHDTFCDSPDETSCETVYNGEQFLDVDVNLGHFWIHPPPHLLDAFVLHYGALRNASKSDISACIVVPRHLVSQLAAKGMLKGMQLLQSYDKGATLFTGKNRELPPPRLDSPVSVYYDPPRAMINSVLHAPSAQLMQYNARLLNVPVQLLFDTGATDNFVSSAFMRRANLTPEPLLEPRQLTYANGDTAPVLGQFKSSIRLNGHKFSVRLLVADLSEHFDILLGKPWLAKNDAIWNLATDVLTLKNFIRVSPLSNKTPQSSFATLCSSKRLKRDLREGATCFHVLVEKLDDQTPVISALAPEVQTLLQKYSKQFGTPPPGLPAERGEADHAIELLPGAAPVFKQMFRLTKEERLAVEKEVADLLEKGLIEPSNSPFGAPVFFVNKKDGTKRMVVDYRGLNDITVKNRYPLPRIDDLLDQLQGAKYFSSLDLRSGFHQVRIPSQDAFKTAFRTPQGHYQFKVLCFGLTNAPATFQRTMNKVFKPFIGKSVAVFMDDILVYSKTAEEHLEHLEAILCTLEKEQLYAKLSKCEFFKSEVSFLGHIVGADGVKVSPTKVEALQHWPAPTNLKQLRGFLGLSNFFRRFIQGYAALCAPMSKLLRSTVIWDWSADCEKSFQAVKHAVTNAPVLRLADYDAPFEVWCDASDYGIGAVLLQDGHPVAFENRKLQGPELNYHPGETELLAVMHALKTWRCYLEGNIDVTVVTDHNPLVWLQTQPNLSPKQVRWVGYLQRFPFKWKYLPGRMNVADPLSRAPLLRPPSDSAVVAAITSVGDATAGDTNAPTPLTNFEQACVKHYSTDPWFSDPANTKNLSTSRGLFFNGSRLVVPDGADLRHTCLAHSHTSPYAGHGGISKTQKLLSRSYWWPNVLQSVEDFVKRCPSCQVNKASNQCPAGLLKPLPIPQGPWESVGMDLITSLPVTAAGHTAILVFIDRFSKMSHFAAITDNITAKDCATEFRHHVTRLHGCPKEIVSDRDPRFTSNFFKEFCKLTDIKQSMSTAFHPQSDGQTERMNRVLEDMLRNFVSPDQTDWDTHLDALEFAYNNSWHQSLQTSPFKLLYGYNPKTPGEAINLSAASGIRVPEAFKFADSFEVSCKQARACLQAAQSRQKAYADTSRRDVSFSVGDEVLLSTQNLKLKVNASSARKLLPKFIGPFKILKEINSVALQLELPACMSKIHDVFHVSLLKHFEKDGTYQPPPPTLFDDDHIEFTVERVLDHRDRPFRNKSRREFLIKWEGYGPEHNTWEPETNCHNCLELIDAYFAYHSKSETLVKKSKSSKRKRR